MKDLSIDYRSTNILTHFAMALSGGAIVLIIFIILLIIVGLVVAYKFAEINSPGYYYTPPEHFRTQGRFGAPVSPLVRMAQAFTGQGAPSIGQQA